MAKSNDEIYDLVMGVDKKIDIHLAVHQERDRKGLKRWQLVLALAGPFIALPMSVIALIVK